MHALNLPTHFTLHAFSGAFKALAYTVLTPFLLVAVLGALLFVMIDFLVVRVRNLILGQPETKGLWEF